MGDLGLGIGKNQALDRSGDRSSDTADRSGDRSVIKQNASVDYLIGLKTDQEANRREEGERLIGPRDRSDSSWTDQDIA